MPAHRADERGRRNLPRRGAASALRWAVCFALVSGIHLVVALFLLLHSFHSVEPSAGTPPPDVVMLGLAPEVAPASSSPPSEPQPEPPPPPAPEPPPQVPPVPAPEPPPVPPEPVPAAPEPIPMPPPQTSVPVPPEPSPPAPPRPAMKPVEHSPPARPAPPKRAAPHPEVVREAKPDQTAVPSAPASAPSPSPPSPGAVAGWRSALVQKLQQAKRYPEAARARDEQGVATVRFTMERDGHILSINLVHSSGSETLDQEAVAMFRRAEPLPTLPDGLGANTLTLTVPVSFSLQ